MFIKLYAQLVTYYDSDLTIIKSDPRSFIVRKTADEVFKVYVLA